MKNRILIIYIMAFKLGPIVKNFLLGGFIVSSISYVGTYFDPLLGAIWWSFPLSLLPSLWFMHLHGKDNEYLARFSISTTYALGLLLISTCALFYFYKRTKTGFWGPIVKSSAIWLVCSILFYMGIKYFNLEKKFM